VHHAVKKCLYLKLECPAWCGTDQRFEKEHEMREHLEKLCPRIKEFLKENINKSRDNLEIEDSEKKKYLDGLDNMVTKASEKA
jgi:hypothetical protein